MAWSDAGIVSLTDIVYGIMEHHHDVAIEINHYALFHPLTNVIWSRFLYNFLQKNGSRFPELVGTLARFERLGPHNINHDFSEVQHSLEQYCAYKDARIYLWKKRGKNNLLLFGMLHQALIAEVRETEDFVVYAPLPACCI